MNFSEVNLPSNRKFGLFFTIIFSVASIYFFGAQEGILLFLTVTLTLSIFSITLVCPDLLLPLNKLWIRCGMMLGKLVNPIIMGFLFFTIFTPVGLFMRLIRRDELRLRLETEATNSHWIKRETSLDADSFQQQF